MTFARKYNSLSWIVGPLVLFFAALAAVPAYDPLAAAGQSPSQPFDLTVKDALRQREIPIRVFLPVGKMPAPVVLFSHGLGGSREGNAFMGKHWAARGYVTVFIQHPGSDSSVWQNKPATERMQALKRAASAKNFLLRAKDIPAVLDQLERWHRTAGHSLAGRLDLKKIGMSGHSFGAVTTQAVSGQKYAMAEFNDARIRAAISFSPSSPRRGNPEEAFGQVRIPWMLMTGTKDIAPIGDANLESRLTVFASLPPGGKYELVLDKAEHSAFTDRPLPGDMEKCNPNHHRVILALSTAFWDAWLRKDPAARNWLDGQLPRQLLEKNDRWHKK